MAVIDAGNGQLVSVPDTKGSTPMVGADGKLYNVPDSSQQTALQNGWKFAEAGKQTPALVQPSAAAQPAPYDPEEASKQHAITEGVAQAEANPVKTGLGRVANEAALGLPEMISDYNATPEQRAVQQEVRKRVDAAHPVENVLERGAGFAASLAIPGVGELGKAAEGAVLGGKAAAEAGGEIAAKTAVEAAPDAANVVGKTLGTEAAKSVADASLARKIGGTAANFAAQGAAYATPQAAVQAAYGDPEQAAETMAWGVGLSGMLGAGLGGLGEAGKGLVGAITKSLGEKDATGLTHLDNIARNILGITDKQAQKLGPDRLTKIVQIADEEGILSAGSESRAGKVKSMLKDAGSKLSDHYQALDSAVEANPDLQSNIPSGVKMAADFDNALTEKAPEINTDLHKDNRAFADQISKTIQDLGTEPTIDEIWAAKKNISSTVGDYGSKSVKAQTVRLADQVLKSHLEQAAEKVYQAGEMPDQYADYLTQKNRYNAGSELSKNLNAFKGTGKLPSSLGQMGFGLPSLAAAASGHPVAAAGLMASKFVGKYIKNEMLGKGVSFLRQAAADPESAPIIGGLLAKAGQAALQEHLDNIPKFITGSKLVARTVAETNPFQHVMGDSTGLSKDQQYAKLTQAIQNANPQNAGQLASVFSGTSLGLSSLVAQKNSVALSYLQGTIPKNPSPPIPFSSMEWKPSKQQQSEYLTRVGLVNNPMAVWSMYQENGGSGQASIAKEVLSTVYPKVYQQMVQRIVQAASDPRLKKPSYDQRMFLSQFTGVPLDPSLTHLADLQAALAAPPAPQPMQMGSSSRRNSIKPQRERMPKWEHAPSLLTDSQQRSYKG